MAISRQQQLESLKTDLARIAPKKVGVLNMQVRNSIDGMDDDQAAKALIEFQTKVKKIDEKAPDAIAKLEAEIKKLVKSKEAQEPEREALAVALGRVVGENSGGENSVATYLIRIQKELADLSEKDRKRVYINLTRTLDKLSVKDATDRQKAFDTLQNEIATLADKKLGADPFEQVKKSIAEYQQHLFESSNLEAPNVTPGLRDEKSSPEAKGVKKVDVKTLGSAVDIKTYAVKKDTDFITQGFDPTSRKKLQAIQTISTGINLSTRDNLDEFGRALGEFEHELTDNRNPWNLLTSAGLMRTTGGKLILAIHQDLPQIEANPAYLNGRVRGAFRLYLERTKQTDLLQRLTGEVKEDAPKIKYKNKFEENLVENWQFLQGSAGNTNVSNLRDLLEVFVAEASQSIPKKGFMSTLFGPRSYEESLIREVKDIITVIDSRVSQAKATTEAKAVPVEQSRITPPRG